MEKNGTALVSVALTTHNSAPFLARQLDSIVHQTHTNLEIIVVDDASSDNTLEILEQYRHILPLVVLRNEKTCGFYRSFERAINNCNGSYIALCDHDDIWLENKLERLVEEIGECSLVCSDARLIDEHDAVVHDSYLAYSGTYAAEGYPFIRLLFYPTLLGCTCLVTKELAEVATPFPEGEIYHDWWLSIAAAKMGGIRYLKEQLTMYRQHSFNHTGAAKRIPLHKLLFRCFSHELQAINDRYSTMMKKRLTGLKQHALFNEANRIAIDDATAYFSHKIQASFHPRCIPIAFTYRKQMFPDYPALYQYMLAIASCL